MEPTMVDRSTKRAVVWLTAVASISCVLGGLAFHGASAQSRPAADDKEGIWTYYGGDARNWRYKPFDQINATNFSQLQVAWRFRTDNLGPNLDYRLGATPIMANGTVYA